MSSILTAVSSPRLLARVYFRALDDFKRLPDLTWRQTEIVPRTYHRRQLRCGTWIVEFVGTRGHDGSVITTAFRACIRVKAGSRPHVA